MPNNKLKKEDVEIIKNNITIGLFIDEYIKNGRNGQDAYLLIHPKSSKEAAKTSAARLLSNANVQSVLKFKLAEYKEKYEITKEFLIENLKWAVNDAKEENDKKNLIKAVEVLAKMCGLNEPEKQEIEHSGISIQYIMPGKQNY